MAGYYEILGVFRTASQKEIKEAYLRLARENHPDRVRDPAKREEADRLFQKINESYNHLRDEKLRREYDKSLDRALLTPEKEAEAYYRKGVLHEQAREYAEAIQYYYEAMRLQPNQSSYIISAAAILARDRSKQRQAVELLEKAIVTDPQARQAYVELGALYSRSGLHTRARRVYERALQALGRDAEIKTLLARATAAASGPGD